MLANLLQILGAVIVVMAILLAYGDYAEYRNAILTWLPFLSFSQKSTSFGKLFTKEELTKFTGKDNSPVYLAILGDVFDVSKGRKHYGQGGGYHFFTGLNLHISFCSKIIYTGCIMQVRPMS